MAPARKRCTCSTRICRSRRCTRRWCITMSTISNTSSPRSTVVPNTACFHLYGIERAHVDDMLETFPIVKRKDEQAHGKYRTKRVLLDIYDAMQQAIAGEEHG